MNKFFSFDLFNRMPIVGIMRNIPSQYIHIIAEKYYSAGLTCLEITMNSPDAEKNISSLVEQYAGKLNVGAGTVCSMNDLERALAANARFIVTPVINEEVIKTCVSEHIPIFPGAYTPSEIYNAWALGAPMIKLFPAGDLKPTYIKDVLAPLSDVHLMPTGGINLDNFTHYLALGARGVGVGSQLFPKTAIEAQDWDALTAIYIQFVTKYDAFIAK